VKEITEASASVGLLLATALYVQVEIHLTSYQSQKPKNNNKKKKNRALFSTKLIILKWLLQKKNELSWPSEIHRQDKN